MLIASSGFGVCGRQTAPYSPAPNSDRVKIQGAVKWFKEAQEKEGAPIIASDACKGQFPVNAVTSAK
jgi:hypothetical protein